MQLRFLSVVCALGMLASAHAQRSGTALSLRPESMEAVNTDLRAVQHKGRAALQLLPLAGKEQSDEDMRPGYLTDLLRDKALEIIRRPHARPFFLTLTFSAPHWPWEAPGDAAYADTASWVRGGSSATYGAMVKSMDDAVSALLKALDEQGLADNTVVFFTSDNGGERYSDMGPYKGGKLSVWEGGVRVPAFVRWPGHIKAGSITEQVAGTMDWTATILSMAGAHTRPDKPLDGVDLTAVLTGKSGPIERELYWRLTQRNWQRALRDGRWKYLQDDKEVEYLFDLQKDPTEKQNLRQAEPARFAALKAKYARWEATMLDPAVLK